MKAKRHDPLVTPPQGVQFGVPLIISPLIRPPQGVPFGFQTPVDLTESDESDESKAGESHASGESDRSDASRESDESDESEICTKRWKDIWRERLLPAKEEEEEGDEEEEAEGHQQENMKHEDFDQPQNLNHTTYNKNVPEVKIHPTPAHTTMEEAATESLVPGANDGMPTHKRKAALQKLIKKHDTRLRGSSRTVN